MSNSSRSQDGEPQIAQEHTVGKNGEDKAEFAETRSSQNPCKIYGYEKAEDLPDPSAKNKEEDILDRA